ncbi:DUF58 domain-containing protein [archaeon]|jgi:uncharacterized protein (DUF58 family)|nr:DUF58 domain-containing protein [archaeon]MBT3720394.1 DUF58 domain-containing protein [archaeon]MBT4022137.1 DUF58 domain-containing protein [archaeon]MBT4272750.1 DUF58 domain-containing protein [archaeon]MBT4461549.1 DUF58 domain-containing protein [archaeon]
MIDTSFLSQLKRFQIIISKKVTSSFHGGRKSSNVGQGLIVNDFRPYVAGDDYRAIDWKIYARSDEFFIKRYEEERNLTSHVLLDTSKSMDYGTKTKKFEYAAMLALGFGYLSLRNNERFNLSMVSNEIDSIRAGRSSNKVLSMLNKLNKVKCKGVIDFHKELKKYKKSIKSKSLVVIISDFLFDIEQIKNTLYLFKNHELRVIQVLDKSETNFNVYGSLVLEDAETGKKLETYISERKRQEYREELYNHIMKIEEETLSLGGKFFLFSTEQPIFDAFYKIINS